MAKTEKNGEPTKSNPMPWNPLLPLACNILDIWIGSELYESQIF